MQNVNCDANGPEIWRLGLLGNAPVAIGRHFQSYVQELMYNERGNVPNGPTLKLSYVDFEFKVTGFLQDCRVRIDFVQQRGLKNHWFNQNSASSFMPQTLKQFRGIAGFGPDRIDTSAYKVLATRRLYLNSMGSNNIADTGAQIVGDNTEGDTAPATTAPAKYCHVRLNLNQVIKQLQPTTNQDDGAEDEDKMAVGTIRGHGSNWSFDNMSPLQNVWAVISTDDTNDITDGPLGDKVQVEIIRRCCWRDPVA